MTTYTIDDHGDIESGLTVVEAAHRLLTRDGYEYEVRREDDYWTLYVSRCSRNSTGPRGMTRSVVLSVADDEDAAREEIARRVIRSGMWERGEFRCLTDEEQEN